MTDRLRDALLDLRGSRKVKRMDRRDRVFLTPRGKPWTEPYVARRAREVFDSLEKTAEDRRAVFCLHLCRHTFASHLVQRGVTLIKVAQLLGHSTTHVTERYAHLAPETGREEAEILQHAFGG